MVLRVLATHTLGGCFVVLPLKTLVQLALECSVFNLSLLKPLNPPPEFLSGLPLVAAPLPEVDGEETSLEFEK